MPEKILNKWMVLKKINFKDGLWKKKIFKGG